MYDIPAHGDEFGEFDQLLATAWFSPEWITELPLRLLDAFSGSLPADGAALLVAADTSRLSLQAVCTSPGAALQIEDIQQMLGEGPAAQAFHSRRPVLVPDLAVHDDRWPVFTSHVVEAHKCAMFSFPLRAGSVRIGVLDLYRDVPGEISSRDLAGANQASTALAEGLLDVTETINSHGEVGPWFDRRGPFAEMAQATGVVAAQLQIPVEEAGLRLRAHAFANSMTLPEVASDILAWRLQLEP